MKPEMIEVYNINIPGVSSRVQKGKYEEIKRVLFQFMPDTKPGMTQNEMIQLVQENVSTIIFDDPTKAGWWMKTVQLDLEARGVIIREKTKPTRWYYLKDKKEVIPKMT